ncbi:DUF6383 domain-containing protein [Hallella colorans]|uniref:DUF6383 domain-containing protein n=1 Tax=Hallella colorans TaxID=1703337 RepID=UPI0010578CF5|nr:DUF6383 domain-containing protein [Hallella colorans]
MKKLRITQKMKTKNLLFAMLLLGSATVVNAQENLLSNPGFEGETIVIDEVNGIIRPTGWYNPFDYEEGDVHFSTIVSEAHSGNAALYMMYASEGYPSGGNEIQCIDASVTGLDKVYTFSFWYKVIKAKNYKGRPIEWKYCIGMWHSSDSDEIGNVDAVADQGIDSQGIVTNGEAIEGDWKFATVDYDFGDRLARYAPSKFYTYDKSKMKYLLIGVKVSSGDLLLDDFSLTVKGGTSGIETTTANQPLPVKVDGGELYVGGVKGSRITVYDAIGRTVANTVATSETTHISNLPKNQLLVVKAGNKTAKVMMR